MADEQRPVIVPVEQTTILFYGNPVIAVRLPDGRIGAVLRTMCEALQLDRYSQVRRIREDETIAESLLLVQVETGGGPQATDVLTAWAIPYWLSGIQLGRVSSEKRAAILAFKREAADTLYRHFSQRPVLPAPRPISTELIATQPAPPAPNASALEWADYYEQMSRFYRWKNAVDARLEEIASWQDAVESRLEGVEEIARLVPEILTQLPPATITPAHQQQVKTWVKQLHDASGKHQATIYNDLYLAFGVPRYQELLEADWPKVERWFRVQIERAKQ